MKPDGHSDLRAALVAATKLFTVAAAWEFLRPTAPPMNNFG
ncbi:MAG: hypothetical protein ACYDH9_16520 [Limisphaerales bacterium]